MYAHGKSGGSTDLVGQLGVGERESLGVRGSSHFLVVKESVLGGFRKTVRWILFMC